jgi:hypothetical protein
VNFGIYLFVIVYLKNDISQGELFKLSDMYGKITLSRTLLMLVLEFVGDTFSFFIYIQTIAIEMQQSY